MICPNCQHEFKTVGQTNFVCYRCGHRWHSREGAAGGDDSTETPRDRRRWLIWFWILFLLGPFLAVLAVPMVFSATATRAFPSWLQTVVRETGPFSVLAPLIAAALGASFCLVRWRRRETSLAGRITATILFAFGLLILYAGIAFAGCVITMSAAR